VTANDASKVAPGHADPRRRIDGAGRAGHAADRRATDVEPGDPRRIHNRDAFVAVVDREQKNGARRELLDELEASASPPAEWIVAVSVDLVRDELARGEQQSAKPALARARAWADDPAVAESQREQLLALGRAIEQTR
jgi:hypothetical protein